MLEKGKPVERVALTLNKTSDRAIRIADKLKQLLKEEGIEKVPLDESPDIHIVVGGDGTLLRAFHSTLGSIPLLGINAGTFGTLLEVEADEARYVPRILKTGSYWIESMGLVEIKGRPRVVALNELLLRTGKVGKSSRIGFAIEGSPVNEAICDGLIIATQTGSLAYSLATSGPVLDPRIEALVVTFVAPWPPSMAISVKSFVVPYQYEIEVWSADREISVIADGLSPVTIRPPVRISGSDMRARFVRFSDSPGSFYRRIAKRMMPKRITGIMDYIDTGIRPHKV